VARRELRDVEVEILRAQNWRAQDDNFLLMGNGFED
jgi:hypothetical protein